MSDNFDDVMANGTDDEIEAVIAEMEISSSDLFAEEDAEEELPAQGAEATDQEIVVEDVVDENASDKNDVVEETEQPVETIPESSPAEEANPSNVIEKDGKFFVEVSKDNADLESKNGKHNLPFALLEGSRGETASVKVQLEEQQRINAELQSSFDESKRVSELYSKQLGEAGLDPKLLPEQMLQDPELAEKLKNGNLETEDVVAAIAASLQQQPTLQQAPEPQADTSQSPAEEAFNQSVHLKNWQTGDAERWEMAKLIDSKLASDPSFDSKTPSERFLEVEKRVMNAFGDEVPVIVQQAEVTPTQPQKAPIPNTPTDIGFQGNDLSPNAGLLEQDAGAMSVSMESMTDAEIEDLLEGASNFL